MDFKFYEMRMIERQDRFSYTLYRGIICYREDGKYAGYIKSLNSPKSEKKNIVGLIVPNKGICLNFLGCLMQNEGFVVLTADKNGKQGFYRQSKESKESIYYAEFNFVNDETFDLKNEINEIFKIDNPDDIKNGFKKFMEISGLKYDEKFYQKIIDMNYEKSYSEDIRNECAEQLSNIKNM